MSRDQSRFFGAALEVIAATCVAVTAISSTTLAQSIEGTVIKSWSGTDGLGSPTGFGVAFVSPYRGLLAPRVGYTWRSNDQSRFGRACGSFEECPQEPVEEDVTLHTFDAGVNARFPIREHVQVRVGVAVLWHRASGKIVGRETGGRLDGESGAVGFALRFGTEWEPRWARGAAILTEARVEQSLLADCPTDVYRPLCGDDGFLSLAGGIAVP